MNFVQLKLDYLGKTATSCDTVLYCMCSPVCQYVEWQRRRKHLLRCVICQMHIAFEMFGEVKRYMYVFCIIPVT
jgi:hypothetical protein